MTFQTYPFPWPPGREPADDPRVLAIAEAARELVEKRDRWLNPEGASEAELAKRTLTNLYNERPTWLRLAHDKLDRAVLDAYGWPHDLPDEDILARLLALNGERGAQKPARAIDAPRRSCYHPRHTIVPVSNRIGLNRRRDGRRLSRDPTRAQPHIDRAD